MIAKFWKFSKRDRSTAIPLSDPLYQVDVKLKDNTSILSPTWVIRGNLDGYKNCNYANFYGRYYYITDIVSLSNNLLEISAIVDVMGSYQEYILSSRQYVERSASMNDTSIYDPFISQKTTCYTPSVFIGRQLNHWNANGVFIVRVVGATSASTVTGIKSYTLAASALKLLINNMFDTSKYDFLSDTSVKSFFNPFQYIVDVKWFPFSDAAFNASSNDEEIVLGWWNTGARGLPVLNTNINDVIPMTIPSGQYTDFRRYSSDWTVARLYIPGCGNYFVDISELGSSPTLEFDIDIATGQANIKLRNGGIIGVYSGTFCSPVSIGQLENNAPSIIATGLQGIGAATSGNLLGTLASGISVAKSINSPTMSLNGTAGNISSLINNPQPSITLVQKVSKDINTANLGRPLCQNVQITSLSGFAVCQNPSLVIPGTNGELQQILQIMREGFYVE